jgi:hypothetical protein
MKTHNTIMVALVIVGFLLIVLAPTLKVGIGFGLLFLICPLMMFGMMYMMGKDHNKN